MQRTEDLAVGIKRPERHQRGNQGGQHILYVHIQRGFRPEDGKHEPDEKNAVRHADISHRAGGVVVIFQRHGDTEQKQVGNAFGDA